MALRHYKDMRPKDFEVLAANNLMSPDDLAHLLDYDSLCNRAPFPVNTCGDDISVGDVNLKIYREEDPVQPPGKKLGVDVVIESAGLFIKGELANIADALGVP